MFSKLRCWCRFKADQAYFFLPPPKPLSEIKRRMAKRKRLTRYARRWVISISLNCTTPLRICADGTVHIHTSCQSDHQGVSGTLFARPTLCTGSGSTDFTTTRLPNRSQPTARSLSRKRQMQSTSFFHFKWTCK